MYILLISELKYYLLVYLNVCDCWNILQCQHENCINFFLSFFFFFGLFSTTLAAYGGSQARGGIGVIAADLHNSSWQRQILNPLSEAMDGTCNLMVPSHICFCCATIGPPNYSFLKITSVALRASARVEENLTISSVLIVSLENLQKHELSNPFSNFCSLFVGCCH